MDRADIAREAFEDLKTKLGAYLARTPIDRQAPEIVDAYNVALRAIRRLEERPGCPLVLAKARAA